MLSLKRAFCVFCCDKSEFAKSVIAFEFALVE